MTLFSHHLIGTFMKAGLNLIFLMFNPDYKADLNDLFCLNLWSYWSERLSVLSKQLFYFRLQIAYTPLELNIKNNVLHSTNKIKSYNECAFRVRPKFVFETSIAAI